MTSARAESEVEAMRTRIWIGRAYPREDTWKKHHAKGMEAEGHL